ncbi:hypothetical protein GQR58_016643 [Nymphon striatum]|nr:hypothetical protein GQR58_016643 [Nymphon striatum]
MKSKFQQLNKKKSRTQETEEYLNTLFTGSDCVSTTPVKTVSTSTTSTSNSTCTSRPVTVNTESETTLHKTCKQAQTIEKLEEELSTLRERCSTKQRENSKMESTILDHTNNIKQQAAKLVSLQQQLKSYNDDLSDCKLEVRRLKTGAAYQKMRRKFLKKARELKQLKACASVEKLRTYKTKLKNNLPSSSTCINIMDRAQVLAKYQVGETIAKSKQWQQHMDGTSRDHNKIMGMQVNTEGGILFAGFSGVAVEDATTLLDNAITMMQEFAYVLDDVTNATETDSMVKTILGKMIATMSDRSSVQKSFNEKLNDYRKEQVNDGELHFLYCNAHFLLGLSTECEKALHEIEANLVKDIGHKLGRDGSAKFGRFSSSSESCTARFVRTGCDVLGPRGDEKKWMQAAVGCLL